MLRKIESFLRGEFYLHIATMFMLMVLLIEITLSIGYLLPLWLLLLIPITVGVVWELSWKFYNKKPISVSDIIATIIGGYFAILILKYI